jgi:3-hydroxyisobutyrate dehydrogenase-like beta-hydroxyacid dehydrogenase
MTTVAFAGLGRMGAPMAARVAAAGHPLAVWNRSTRPEAVPDAATVGATPAEAARGAQVIITMVADAAALTSILDGPEGLLAGAQTDAVLVDMSTIGPSAALAAAERCATAGVTFLDAPVSGSVPAASAGTLLTMIGGPADALERALPVLRVMTATQIHLGSTGTGATMKLALNLMLAVTNEAIAETLLIAERAGIARERAYDVLAGGAVASPYVGYKRAAFADPARAPVAFSVGLMDKDVTLALAMAEALGVSVPAGTAAGGTLRRALAEGLAETDVVNVLRTLAAEAAGSR